MKKRIILDDNWFIFQSIILSPKFKEFEKEFYSYFDKVGLPIPLKGFKSNNEVAPWFYQLEEKGIAAYDHVHSILDYYNVNRENKTISSTLFSMFIFKEGTQVSVTQPPIQVIKMKKERGTANWLFTVRVNRDTRKMDLDVLWDRIELLFYKLNDIPKSRNSEWTSFENDRLLYKLSLEAINIPDDKQRIKGKSNSLPEKMRTLNDKLNIVDTISEDDKSVNVAIKRYKDFLSRVGLQNIF